MKNMVTPKLQRDIMQDLVNENVPKETIENCLNWLNGKHE